MGAEENKAIARRYWDEGWGMGNVAIVDEIFAPDTIFHPGVGTASHGTEAQKRGPTRWRTAFPDLRSTIEDIFAEGDKVIVRWTLGGTHRGNIEIPSVGTIPPTGKQVSFAGMDIYHFRGGKIVEGWRHWSSLQLVQQLGVVPTAG
jgi:predicted ester cyclase